MPPRRRKVARPPARSAATAPTRLVNQRIGFLFAGFLLLLAVAIGRAGYLLAFEGGKLRSLAAGQQVVNVTVVAKRGTITDRRGTTLAASEDASTIFATPYLVKDPVGTARKIAPLLKQPPAELTTTLADRKVGFAYLERKADPRAGARIERMEIEGIGVIDDARRYYPEGELASQVLGTVGIDDKGLSGLEQALNSTLSGSDGKQRIVRDARGDPVSLDEQRSERSGHDIRLTIDAQLQARAESVLAGVGETYQPEGASAIVMDPRNGQILAMANWPGVNANRIGDAPPSARINHAVGLTYEPGSTFKAFTVAGALSDRLVTPNTTFSLGPAIQVADRTILEAEEGTAYGTLNVGEILSHSSNVGAVTIGLKLGDERFDYWVRRFGFSNLTGVPVPGESAGIVPEVSEYSGSSMGNLPIGQGLAVTPLQMADAYSAIANGGVLVRPHLIAGGAPDSTPPNRRVIPRRVSRHLQQMLKGVLGPGGTAPEAAVPGYDIAGKTGTAQKAENGGYSESKYVSSFIGFAPATNARLLVAVIVDEPKGTYLGGKVAAPAFEKIASFALPYLGIAPN
ncbi:MAG: penicillin-binding protein 2 [Solirubrobacterales bacterium]